MSVSHLNYFLAETQLTIRLLYSDLIIFLKFLSLTPFLTLYSSVLQFKIMEDKSNLQRLRELCPTLEKELLEEIIDTF